MGIEPTRSAWKAEVLPLNYIRLSVTLLSYHAVWYMSRIFCCEICRGIRRTPLMNLNNLLSHKFELVSNRFRNCFNALVSMRLT